LDKARLLVSHLRDHNPALLDMVAGSGRVKTLVIGISSMDSMVMMFLH